MFERLLKRVFERQSRLAIAERLRRSGYFDTDFYLRINEDVRALRINPAVHYMTSGIEEGRDPHPMFDTRWYLSKNDDVRCAGCNPLVHFADHGRAEGRSPSSGIAADEFRTVRESHRVFSAPMQQAWCGLVSPIESTTARANTIVTKRVVALKKLRAAMIGGDALGTGNDIPRLTYSIKIESTSSDGDGQVERKAAEHLKHVLGSLNQKVTIDGPEEWYEDRASLDDVVIAIRGAKGYAPQTGSLNILWCINSPERIEFEEWDRFQIRYTGSRGYAAFLRTVYPDGALPLFHHGEEGQKTKKVSQFRSHPIDAGGPIGAGESVAVASVDCRTSVQGAERILDHSSPELLTLDDECMARKLVGDVLSCSELSVEPDRRSHGRDSLSSHRHQGKTRRLRVGAFVHDDTLGPETSAFIRLICPLTSHGASREIDFEVLNRANIDSGLPSLDVCIVQRTAVVDCGVVDSLLRHIEKAGVKLVVDNDDAFALIEPNHPAFAYYERHRTAFERIMAASDQAWFSTTALRDVYSDICLDGRVVPNGLDRRLWNPDGIYLAPPADCSSLRLLYMGTLTHHEDLQLIYPALDSLVSHSKVDITLTTIGGTLSPPERRWLRSVPLHDYVAPCYPRFVRWLMQQGQFDAALSPLQDNAFNRCKSDIKFLDYCALGAIPVLSNLAPYQGDAKTKSMAILVDNQSEAWEAAIKSLLARRAEHRPLVERNHNYLWQERSAASVGALQLTLLQNLVDESK